MEPRGNGFYAHGILGRKIVFAHLKKNAPEKLPGSQKESTVVFQPILQELCLTLEVLNSGSPFVDLTIFWNGFKTAFF